MQWFMKGKRAMQAWPPLAELAYFEEYVRTWRGRGIPSALRLRDRLARPGSGGNRGRGTERRAARGSKAEGTPAV
eukprot:1580356-Prymnesium_polylepis.1